MTWLKVAIEGCHPGCDADLYTELDPLTRYTEKELLDIGQDMVNERHSWGIELIEDDAVPDGERTA